MAEVVGVVAAAFQFAEVTLKAIKLIREIQQGAEAGPVRLKITQLETFVEVAQKIARSWTQDDPLTEKILRQCTSTVTDLISRLERVDVAGSDTLKEKAKKALRARWEKDDIEELFRQLCRDQVALLLHRSFASDSQLIQKVMDGVRQLLNAQLRYSEPHEPNECRFLDGMFITDPRDDRSALISRKGQRVEGTCSWVTETDVYRWWLVTTTGPTGLMLQGSPGKGKTMIAIYLTEQLELLSDPSHSVIYFFCDNRNPKQNNALSVVRCLLWQLCRLRPALLCHGTKELRERGDNIDNLLEFETLWRIFDAMRQDDAAGNVTCVIDGLDECDDNSVFAILNKLWRLKPDPRFKFLILCRPPTPRQQLPAATSNVVRLLLDPDQDEKVHQDVIQFVRQRVQEVANASPERQWSEKLRLHVEATLQKKAGGTFLWVGFVAKDLQQKTSTEVRKYLKSLPVDLNEIYDRILKGLPTEYRTRIRSLLHWITLAKHPMTLSELVSLINTHNVQSRPADSDNDSDTDSSFETEEDIVQDLLAFIGHFTLVSEGTVYFVHQSAKDYLLRSIPATDPDLEYFRILDREAGHEELARWCLDYLHCQLPLVKKEDGWGSVTYEYTSFHYALHFWRHHIEQSGRTFRYPDTVEKIVRLFRPEDLLRQWLQCLGDDSSVVLDVCSFPQMRTLYRHEPLKISDLEAALISQSGSPDAGFHLPMGTVCRPKPGTGTDLGFAISLGLDAAFDQMLGDLSVDEYTSAVGAKPRVFNWPLHIALSSKKEPQFQRLLDKYGSTAVSREKGLLSYAASQPSDRSGSQSELWYLSALLAITAEPRALYGLEIDEVLFDAVRKLRTDFVLLLLEKGADPNATDKCGSTPLHNLASHFKAHVKLGSEQLEVARTLLSQKTNCVHQNVKDSDGNTPLHIAASCYGLELAQLLLEFGATSDAVNLKGRTPLHCAAIGPLHILWPNYQLQGSWRKTAELLITGFPSVSTPATDRALVVDMQDRFGRTALLLAALYGNDPMIQLLLAHKASVECKDHIGRTALHMAAAGGSPSTLKILLRVDDHVNAIDAHRWTTLDMVIDYIGWSGVLESRASCMKRLIRKGATCSGKNRAGQTLLHFLARKLQSRVQSARKNAQDDQKRAQESQEREARETLEDSQSEDRWAKQVSVPWRWNEQYRSESFAVDYPAHHFGADRPSAGMRRGAVFVTLPHRRGWTDAEPWVPLLTGLDMRARPTRYWESETEIVSDNNMFGGKMRRYLAELSIDEATKDEHGLTAREYYPFDEFWDSNEDGNISPGSESDSDSNCDGYSMDASDDGYVSSTKVEIGDGGSDVWDSESDLEGSRVDHWQKMSWGVSLGSFVSNSSIGAFEDDLEIC